LEKLKRYFFVLFVVIFGTQRSQALNAPEITCVTVNALGVPTLNWNPVADPGGVFEAYVIQRSLTFGGVYLNIATINDINVSSYTDVLSDINALSACYRIVTEYTSNGVTTQSASGLPTCALKLFVAQSLPIGQAIVNWNQPWENAPTGSENMTFRLYMEYPAGIWTLISSLPYSQMSHLHEVNTCGDFLNFRVELEIPGSCSFVSNLDGDFFQDTTYPVTPIITSVQVDSTSNLATIQWLPSSSSDTFGYIIYQCLGAQTVILDTLWGYNNTFYEYQLSVAGTLNNESFLVAAFDGCFTGNPPTPNTSPTSPTCHRSIFLQTSWFPCQTTIDLTWNPPSGWVQGIDSFEIWVKTNGNAPELIATVAGNVFAFTHENITDGNQYKYYVKALATGQTWSSLSNGVTVTAVSSVPPAYVYLASASVTGPNSAEMRVSMAPTGSTFTFYLERQRVGSGIVKTVDVQQYLNESTFSFVDTDLETGVHSYQYRIDFENICGDLVGSTNIGQTILLGGTANTEFFNTLEWSAYKEWSGLVVEYRIHRSIDGGNFEVIATVSGSQFFFQDNVYELPFTKGEFCYTIEAVEGINDFGFAESAMSNTLCLTQEPKIWIPSAFTANGLNPIFKPVFSFADYDRYVFSIIDRWGTEIFRSNDPEIGWDGKVNGSMSPEGIYHYHMAIGDGNGALIARQGAVMLIVEE
jgi:hypothetical protein